MRKFYLTLLLAFLSIIIAKAQNNHSKEILVFFSEGVSQEVKQMNGKTIHVAKINNNKLKTSLNSIGINDSLLEAAIPVFDQADTLKNNSQDLEQPDMTKLFRLKVSDDKKRQEIIKQLKSMPEVLYAEPNVKAIPQATPDDTRFGDQWGLKNVARPGSDIHAEAAWDIYTGNPNNIIAIVDGGTETTHKDLDAKISGGDAGIGWDGHGTLVAGVAAAESFNGQGISGVDWKARIHPQRVDNATDAVVYYQAIVDAVNYSPNVFVINNSWTLADANDVPGIYSTTVRQAFAYAYKKKPHLSCCYGRLL